MSKLGKKLILAMKENHPLIDKDCSILDGSCDCRDWRVDCRHLPSNKKTQPKNKEVYSDCTNPQGCVYCGGYCPYTIAKSSDV